MKHQKLQGRTWKPLCFPTLPVLQGASKRLHVSFQNRDHFTHGTHRTTTTLKEHRIPNSSEWPLKNVIMCHFHQIAAWCWHHGLLQKWQAYPQSMYERALVKQRPEPTLLLLNLLNQHTQTCSYLAYESHSHPNATLLLPEMLRSSRENWLSDKLNNQLIVSTSYNLWWWFQSPSL